MNKHSTLLRSVAVALAVAPALYGLGLPAQAADQGEVQPAGPAWLQKAERKVDKGAAPVTRAVGKAGSAVGRTSERAAHAVRRGSDKMGAKMHEKLPQGHKPPDVRGNIGDKAD
jgi:hypothetical protein